MKFITISDFALCLGFFSLLISSPFHSQSEAEETVSSVTPSPPAAEKTEIPLDQYDRDLVRLRLEKIYGKMSFKIPKDWEASFEGKKEIWHWSPKGWSCPTGTGQVICKDWVPTAFEWWVTKKAWLAASSPLKKEGYFLGENRSGALKTETADTQQNQSAEDQEAPGQATMPSSQKRLVDEVWQWKTSDSAPANLYISGRNQLIDRIDFGNSVEYIDWTPTRVPSIEAVTMERNGIRVTILRSH